MAESQFKVEGQSTTTATKEPHFEVGRWRALPTPPQSNEARTVKRRNRLPVSSARESAQGATGSERGSGVDAHDRLRQLESMVMQMVEKAQEGGSAAVLGQYERVSGSAHISVTEPKPHNEDSGKPHWTSILNGIQELRSVMGPEEEMPDANDDLPHLQEKPILLGAVTGLSLPQILQDYLQDRVQVDRRLSTYFNNQYMIIPIIHPQTFRSQYEQFWVSPNTADPIWVAMLFAILSLSAHITCSMSSQADAIERDRYLAASAQCLNLGDYTRPKKFVIEALLLLCQSRYMTRLDPSREVALIMGIVTRLAFQICLHREPPNWMPFFEAEMRRRTWLIVVHMDLQVACQFGVPPSTPFSACDVADPRNLQNDDFGEHTRDPAPARPESELTPVIAFILKSRIMRVLAEIYHHALSLKVLPDSEILRLDTKIRSIRDDMPERIRIRPMSQAYADPTHLVVARYACELLAQKSLCILHRKRMAVGNEPSKQACVDASMTIVRELIDLYAEFQPGGQVQGQQWMLSLTMLNDFLLAIMVLCLALVTEQRRKPGLMSSMKEVQLDLLQQARLVCVDLSQRSRGAGRVAEAVGVLLPNLRQPMDGFPTPSGFSNDFHQGQYSTGTPIERRNDVVPLLDPSLGREAPKVPEHLDPFAQMMSDSAEVDWTAFDQYINNWDYF